MKGAQGAMGSGGGAAGGAGGAGGGAGGFMQMLGASGGSNKSEKPGMAFANAGLQLPNTPSAQQMVSQLPQNMNMGQMQQGSMGERQAPQTFNSLIQMLMNGGR